MAWEGNNKKDGEEKRRGERGKGEVMAGEVAIVGRGRRNNSGDVGEEGEERKERKRNKFFNFGLDSLIFQILLKFLKNTLKGTLIFFNI